MADPMKEFPLSLYETYLAEHGISIAEAAQAGFQYRQVNADIRAMMPNLLPYTDEFGILIPYPNHPDYFGWRRIKMRRSGFGIIYNENSKFIVPRGGNRAYIPTQGPLLEGATVVITESAIKALTVHWTMGADAYVIGLNGCQGASSRIDGDRDRLLPELVNIPWHRVREAIVLFDSNISTNPDVEAGAARLIHILESRFRVNARAIILPHHPDGSHWGLDDFSVMYGREALRKFILTAPRVTPAFVDNRISNLYELRRQYLFSHQTAEWVRYEDGAIFKNTEILEATMAEYRHENGDGGTVPTWNAYKVWAQRGEVNRIVYRPGDDKIVDGDYNIYNPPALIPEAGDVGIFLDWVERLIPDPEQRDTLLRIFAHLRQRPGIRIPWIIMLCSPLEGIGKSALAQLVMNLVGRHNAASVSFEHLTGHNEMMMGRHVLLLDDAGEAANKGERRARSAVLRRLATDSTFTVNPKFQRVKEFDNYITVFLTSNALDGGIELLEQGRREFLPDLDIPYRLPDGGVDRRRMMDVVTWCLGPGLTRIASYFDHYDLTGWEPVGEPPSGHAKRLAAAHSRSRYGESYEVVLNNLFSGEDDRRGDQLDDLKLPRTTRYITRDQIKTLMSIHHDVKWCGDQNFQEWVTAASQYRPWKCRIKGEKGTKTAKVVGRTTFYDMIGGGHDYDAMARQVGSTGLKDDKF